MLDEMAWLTASKPVYPNGVLSGRVQDCVLACHVLPDQTPSSVSLWTLCWAIPKQSQQRWEHEIV